MSGHSADLMRGRVVLGQVAMLRRNGAGKTTTLRTMMGVLAPRGD